MTTEEQIEALYEKIRWRIDKVNADYLKLVGEQIAKIGKLNPSSIDRLAQMRIYGANTAKIKRELAKALNVSEKEIEKLFRQAIEEEYTSAEFQAMAMDKPITPLAENHALQYYIRAVAKQTAGEFLNFSNTTSVDGNYQEVVSDAVDAVSRGVVDYNSAIRSAMRKLGGDGLQVTYESGYRRRMDSAIRQNILDGVRQISQQANKMLGEEIGADGVELSAHPYSALDHEPVQGRQFSLEEFERMQNGESFYDADGNFYLGFKRPIGQWNCYHIVSYIVLGISKRRYTDEQLQRWKEKNHKGCVIDGKVYTIYQASQLMRKLETEIRRQKDIGNLARLSGDDVLRREAQAKIRDLKKKYFEVADAAGLKERWDKTVVRSYKAPETKAPEIQEPEIPNAEDIGRIDINKYSSVTSEKIQTSRLILTDNQKEHIIERRGKEAFEKYSKYFKDVAENPDYIFSDPKHENTAIASKTILQDGKGLNLVIRLAVASDEQGKCNSIITAIIENEKRYKQRLRNNIPLYKSE